MKLVLQRVSRASVTVDGAVISAIGQGLVVLVGFEQGDDPADVEAAVDKMANLRVFSDDSGKMNWSLGDVGGELLLVSQFTLLGDVSRGRRPSFTAAAAPEDARPLLEYMVDRLQSLGVPTSTGIFGASMQVDLVNDGPVTLVLDVRNARLG